MAAAIFLAFQPGQALADETSAQGQAVQSETEGQFEGEEQSEAEEQFEAEVQSETETQSGTGKQSEIETARDGWAEEYTDTDSRRGTLSVRCQVFQGFHGAVELHIRNMAGDWERDVALTEKGGYALNLSLPVGAYRIEETRAQTDGRKYRCQTDQTEVAVDDGTIVMCQITVSPDSVYHLPYENDSLTDSPSARSAGSGQKSAEPPETIGEEKKQESELRVRWKVQSLWFLGISGAALCLGGLCYMIKRRKEV